MTPGNLLTANELKPLYKVTKMKKALEGFGDQGGLAKRIATKLML